MRRLLTVALLLLAASAALAEGGRWRLSAEALPGWGASGAFYAEQDLLALGPVALTSGTRARWRSSDGATYLGAYSGLWIADPVPRLDRIGVEVDKNLTGSGWGVRLILGGSW